MKKSIKIIQSEYIDRLTFDNLMLHYNYIITQKELMIKKWKN